MLMCRNEDARARNFPKSTGFCIILNVCIKETSCLNLLACQATYESSVFGEFMWESS